jgi:hypothetical protein
MCCNKGSIILPAFQPIPNDIKELFTGSSKFSKNFLENIRKYNSALAFASMSANFDAKMKKPGPYFFKICGQVYHYISNTLYPSDQNVPKYTQLYILDTKEATETRLGLEENKSCEPEVTVIIQYFFKFKLYFL